MTMLGTEDGSLNFLTIATSMVTRPLPLLSYATTVGVHSSLLLFTALFLPRTSLVIFNNASNFPFLQPASSLDRPQPEFLEVLTASPPLTIAWLCAGVFLISFSWGGRIRRQAYEQHKPVDRTDFEAKGEEIEWQRQGTIVCLQLFLHLFSTSQFFVELAQVSHFNSSGCRHIPRNHRALWCPNHEVCRTFPSTRKTTHQNLQLPPSDLPPLTSLIPSYILPHCLCPWVTLDRDVRGWTR